MKHRSGYRMSKVGVEKFIHGNITQLVKSKRQIKVDTHAWHAADRCGEALFPLVAAPLHAYGCVCKN